MASLLPRPASSRLAPDSSEQLEQDELHSAVGLSYLHLQEDGKQLMV